MIYKHFLCHKHIIITWIAKFQKINYLRKDLFIEQFGNHNQKDKRNFHPEQTSAKVSSLEISECPLLKKTKLGQYEKSSIF